MAATNKGRQLTEQHRQDQVQLSNSLVKALLQLFRALIDYGNIDRSAVKFAQKAAPLVFEARRESRRLSSDYLEAFSRVEARGHVFNPSSARPDSVSYDDVVGEMYTTASSVLKRMSSKGYSTGKAMSAGETAVSGRGKTLAGDGGRRLIENYVRTGLAPIGYARVVDADPCPFCAMLASRGAVTGDGLYKSDSFDQSNARFRGDGLFKVHDGCDCTLEPVYRVKGKVRLPGNGDELAREWAEIAAGRDDQWHVWARWRESGTLPDDYEGPLEGTRRVRGPVTGQHTGTRDVKPRRNTEVRDLEDWSKEELQTLVGQWQERLTGVEGEMSDLIGRGQTERDVPVMALARERKALVARIEKYQAHISSM